MNLGITGASGFLGRQIIDLALRRGHEVIAFSRTPERGVPGCEMRRFDLDVPLNLQGCEAVIHLAGESVAGFWTPAKKRRIRESRVRGTRHVVEAIKAAAEPPEVLVCASGVGLYGDQGDVEITEASPGGEGFLADVVRAWEGEAVNALSATRVVLLRTPIVLGSRGGALPLMLLPFKLGLGARLGDGEQWMPWIHLLDHAMLTLFAVENLEANGPINACAPWPVRNREFTQRLAAQLRRPAWLAAPKFALQVLGDFSRELLESRRVVPAKAAELGFRFQFPELPEALRDLLP